MKSGIGYARDQRMTIKALGLRRLNQTVVREESPSLWGMIMKVVHLIRVERQG